MQATPQLFPSHSNLWRNVRFFAFAPVLTAVSMALLLTLVIGIYASQHRGRVYTGVMLWGTDLSQMNREEAETALATSFVYENEAAITFIEPETGRQWSRTPTELGLSFDTIATTDAIFAVGRTGSFLTQVGDRFTSWYYGRRLSPVLVMDKGKLNGTLAQMATEMGVSRAPLNAQLENNDDRLTYTPAQSGQSLDITAMQTALFPVLTNLQRAQIELPIITILPHVYDSPEAMARIQNMIATDPITFYLQKPLSVTDLQTLDIPEMDLTSWTRVEMIEIANGTRTYNVFLDEVAVRQWLQQKAFQIYQEPVNARYYFDDDIRELVLVTPHINGRKLNIEATLALLKEQLSTPNRSIPFVVDDIVPAVHSNAKALDLGITELISERTTWFYGSSDARKRNIARSAANFYGIDIATGEEFSFNKYLGTISEDDGYQEGLIIVGGQTIKGIGGGVCQVSTTVFQTVFFAGFPVTERWQHGYLLGYYNDGEGPGMDATVYSPIVDFKFVNNTPYHLLIENYYNETEESLTFKFYSTSMGRRVEKTGPLFENIVAAPAAEADVWTFDPDLEPGTVQQIDWATEGARVTVGRTVYNANDEIMIQEEFVSNYIPWPGGYMYGTGVNAPDYSLVPDEN